MERWPRGLRHPLAKRTWANHRGFESLPFRHMVAVAKWLRRLVVIQLFAGSNPVGHPKVLRPADLASV